MLAARRTRHLGIATCMLAAATASGDPTGFVTRDAKFRQGVIEFTRKDFDAPSHPGSQERIVFAADGRMLHRIERPMHLGNDLRAITFVRGSGWRYVQRENLAQVEVTFEGRDPWPRDEDPLFYLSERPSFAMAAGLSNLKVVKQEDTRAGLVVHGNLPDKTTVRLVYGDRSKAVPTRLERLYQGKVVNDWSYEGAQQAAPGLWVPKRSTYRLLWRGNPKGRSLEIHRADLNHQPASQELVTDWYRPGVTVFDRRVEPVAVWQHEELKKAAGGATTLDPDKLLELSRQRSQYLHNALQKAQLQNTRREREPSGGLAAFLTVFAAVFTCSLTAIALRRRRRSV